MPFTTPSPFAADSGRRALLRKRRMMQMVMLVLVSFGGTAVLYLLRNRPDVSAYLGTTAAAMVPVMWLIRRGRHDAAMMTLLLGVTTCMTLLIWQNEGLQDTVLLAYPALMTAAAQLLNPRRFWLFTALLLLSSLLIGLGTLFGWRDSSLPSTIEERITDCLTILLVTGILIWFLSRDMQLVMLNFQRQIARLRESERHLSYLAQHDQLTQLPNRHLASELFERAIRACENSTDRMAILFIDLDNFKEVNDSIGHGGGDEFLRIIAERLLGSVRQTDIVARQGGDEFLVGLTDLQDAQSASIVANQIMGKLNQSLVVRDLTVLPTCSIGIAIFPDHGEDFETLVRHADIAMYKAKESGRNTHRLYSAEIESGMQAYLHLIASLRQALVNDEFHIYYQPIFDLKTGGLVGVEALLRWDQPGQGIVTPGQFIYAAERSGLIIEIGEWLLHQACEQVQSWHRAGAAPLTLAVNLSPVQCRRDNLPSVVQAALLESGLPADQLELEITESTLIDDVEAFIALLHQFKAIGVHIAVDDFGTGYSNLSYLQRFPVDRLKVDQSFVRRLNNSAKDIAMVQTIIHLAKSLDLQVTAEGIEDRATQERLTALGCDHAQGFALARPMPAQEFEQRFLGQPKP